MIALKCPFCTSEGPYGTSNGKKRYACNNPGCSPKTCYAEYRYNGCKPEVKKAIIKWAVDGAGVRATARIQESIVRVNDCGSVPGRLKVSPAIYLGVLEQALTKIIR
ncbi:MAG: hypothetical protein LBL76_10470 [Treponema sp.]|nr:hypothetical protein [Treponema sp.]